MHIFKNVLNLMSKVKITGTFFIVWKNKTIRDKLDFFYEKPGLDNFDFVVNQKQSTVVT